jgi:hypothetical protein
MSMRYHQHRFCSEKATSEHLLVARRSLGKTTDSSEGRLAAIFIDFSKAFIFLSTLVKHLTQST